MDNQEIANILYEIAEILDIQRVQFKPKAYRRAAQSIETLSEDIKLIYERGELLDIPGVGTSIGSKIEEIIKTGKLDYLEKLREEIPKGLRELMELEGVGPKTAEKLYENFKNVDELESAARQGKIRNLLGFGVKKEESILKAIELYRTAQKRFLLGDILPIATKIENKLKALKEVIRISVAGSIRRKKDTVGDMDILIASEEPKKVMDLFTKLPDVKDVLSQGMTKSTVILRNNMQADLRVVEEESWGSALQYFTGSKDHNIKLRELAIEKGLKLNEYGLFEKESEKKIAGKDEKGIYEVLGLNYIEPELRENWGEIEAASKSELPILVNLEEIKGDLHVHTTWSDGKYSIEDMALAAKSLSYKYLAICDHSKGLQIANGLDEDTLKKQIEKIELINRKMDDFTLLSGIEANIDSNGELDIRNDVLKDLDIVIAGIHSGLKKSEKEMTERVLNAMNNDFLNVLSHPMGRILNRRNPIQINLLKIFKAAAESGIIMEINAYPDRLDLPDLNCFKARDYNLKFSIGTDAHHKEDLKYMELGVATARRGWLEKKDIINTLDIKRLKKLLKS